MQKEAGAQQALTRYIADFVVAAEFGDIPAAVIEIGRKSILDGLGLALSGAVAQTGAYIRHHLDELSLKSGSATVIGGGRKVAPRFAAFANATGIHADDYDDTQLATAKDRVYGLLTHPTAPALPAALAVGEAVGAAGRNVMLAYHLGVEVECKIADAIEPRHYRSGFHTTATCGTFAAATAAAKLMHLDTDHTARALSIAASQSAGLRENFGTMTKPFHAGRACESGVVAAQFASYGWTATDRILEAPRGFFQAAGGGYDRTAIAGRLGHPWTFANPGISIKPYPSGSLTHPGMTEMLRLITGNEIAPEAVRRVRVGTNSNMPNALIHHRPRDELQAKFSMEFCMAILLLERRAGLREFTDATVRRPDVQAMFEKIDFVVDEQAENAGYDKMTTLLDIELVDGRHIRGCADFGKGSPANPMSFLEVADKFRDCADFAGVDRSRADAIVEQVGEFETLPNLERLMGLLIAGHR